MLADTCLDFLVLAPKIPDSARTKEQRIAAISATANSLRERIAAEASRLDNLRMLSKREKTPPPQTTLYSGFRGALPGKSLNLASKQGSNLFYLLTQAKGSCSYIAVVDLHFVALD